MQVDWSKAPEWAEWHAFNNDGTGYWYESEPAVLFWSWIAHNGSQIQGSGLISKGGHWKQSLTRRPHQHTNNNPTTATKTKHAHYHKPTNGVEAVDVYWVLNAWEVDCHAIGHAVKKLLNAGQRGVKTKEQDLREAIDSIERAIELLE